MSRPSPGLAAGWLTILVLTSCARSQDCFRAEVYCAGFVTGTLGLDDEGINRDTWAGLEESRTAGLVDQIAYIESVDPRDYEKNITYFAQNGYDLIVTGGTGLRDETLHAADLYPDSVFVGMDQPQEETRPNLIPITFPEDKMGLFAGALAARLSRTRIVAGVCETSGIDSMWRYCEGFRAGALLIDKKMKVLVDYRDNGSQDELFIDEAWGRDHAQDLIDRGADVLFAAGGATGQAALRVASDAGILAIGAERDQAAALGISMVTSVYGRAGAEIRTVLASIKKEERLIGPVTGKFGYVPVDDKFPEGLRVEMDGFLSVLLSGDVQTNIPLQKP